MTLEEAIAPRLALLRLATIGSGSDVHTIQLAACQAQQPLLDRGGRVLVELQPRDDPVLVGVVDERDLSQPHALVLREV